MSLSIRLYQSGEEDVLRELFFETIRHVNIADYSESQVVAWAPEQYDKSQWCQRIRTINPFVATIHGQIVGYASIESNGYIDHFYCHRQFQGQGVGRSLMRKIVTQANELCITRLYSQVSLTAKPFFERYDFCVVKEQRVCIRGQELTNFLMEKFVS